jgi:predicted ATP-grasp superfamily ATP-dependent carboligase
MKTVKVFTEPPALTATVQEITSLMRKLGCSRAEAVDIIKADREIDKMSIKEAQADLTQEQKQAIKKASLTGSKKRTEVKRERKIDEVKKRFINGIRVYLEGCGAQVEPLKNETDLHFIFENDHFSIKLTKHRPPKK